MDSSTAAMHPMRRRLLIGLLLAAIVGGLLVWIGFRRVRANYEAFRERIEPGITVAGVPVGGLSREEAEARVSQEVARTYGRDFVLHFQGQELGLSPAGDLGLEMPVGEMVAEAAAASHSYGYWSGLWRWLRGQAIRQELDIPLRLTFNESAAMRVLGDLAQELDQPPAEPMVDVQNRTFIPGRPGYRLDLAPAAAMINERVADPAEREITLPVTMVNADQSPARVESMLGTLVPVMAIPPVPPTFYTATLPLSTTGGIAGTPTVSYTGDLTWTFPYFATYSGELTSTTGFFFEPGQPGRRFDVAKAARQVELALASGVTQPIPLEAEMVPAPPITQGLLIAPLEARLGKFPGVTSILVQNLQSGQVVYESNADQILSGMSIVKIGIMVEVYRSLGGTVDQQTDQELLDMLGSESCNTCANRLLAEVGGGSASAGAQRVTATMRRLGLDNFYLCAPFRIVSLWEEDSPAPRVWSVSVRSRPILAYAVTHLAEVRRSHGLLQADDLWYVQSATPRYDRCVRTTPREMAKLLEMIYQCTEDRGTLRATLPEIPPTACEEMIAIMASNDLRNMLGAGIPAEVTLAHKHGFSGYNVPWGDTRGEVGIVFPEGNAPPWLVSFYIWQDTPWIDWGINQPLYRDISNMLYNYFGGDRPFWPLPPWTPPPEQEPSGTQARSEQSRRG